ncbi:MAG TPA: S24 family peptidase [Bryobacteraceae bacterium]|nr:S24 family peptidase [Bryobacteraceae bacterium]
MSVALTHSARYCILGFHLPGRDPLAAGVLLEDPEADALYIRLRRDWDEIAPEEAEVLSALDRDFSAKAKEMGAARLLERLEDTLSNVLQVSQRREAVVHNFDRALARLYREHVHSTVLEFVTHLPRYSLAVAAGKFLDNEEVEDQGWEEAPPELRLTRDMFVASIVGRSMEPAIPDGSLCIFRAGVTGSRQGRLVLVEALGRGENDRYTVKRYRSEKSQGPGGSWAHERIRLEPLNPEFEAWDLSPEEERFRVIAEFVQVLG